MKKETYKKVKMQVKYRYSLKYLGACKEVPWFTISGNWLAKAGFGIGSMQANYPARFGAWGHATLYNMTGTIGNSYAGSYAYRFFLWGF